MHLASPFAIAVFLPIVSTFGLRTFVLLRVAPFGPCLLALVRAFVWWWFLSGISVKVLGEVAK